MRVLGIRLLDAGYWVLGSARKHPVRGNSPLIKTKSGQC